MNRSSITSGNVFPWPCFFTLTPPEILENNTVQSTLDAKKRNRLCNCSNFTLPNCSLTNHCIIRAFRPFFFSNFFSWTICLQLKNAAFYEWLTKAIESLKEKKRCVCYFYKRGSLFSVGNVVGVVQLECVRNIVMKLGLWKQE